MTSDDLTTHVWDRLPARKRLVGRRAVDRIVWRAVKAWPHGVIEQCDRQQADVLGKYFARSLERDEKHEVGMGFLASVVLGAIIARIVGVLFDWWWAKQDHRIAMREMTRAA